MSDASQLYVFTGENTAALRREREGWTQAFMAKHGEENLMVLDGDSLTFRSFLDEVSVAPFLASKRLTVVRGLPSWEAEEIASLPSLIHPDSLALLWEAKPDKRLSSVKAWLKLATVKEFPHLSDGALLAWTQTEAARLGARLSAAACRELIALVGEDEETLSREVERLSLRASATGTELTVEDVRDLVSPSSEQEVWHLTNLLSSGQGTAALHYVRDMLARGEDPYALWNMLLWYARMMTATWAAVQDGAKNPAAVASEWKVPFPTARTLVPVVARLEESSMRKKTKWAAEWDTALKTGGVRATQDGPQELQCLIDRFVVLLSDAR